MSEARETVILVHGLWMRGVVLLPQQRWLTRHDYTVQRFSYASMGRGLQHNVEALARFVAESSGTTIHLVGHSLGGLVILTMLAQHPDPRVRRVVLMGSPCMACHCASVMARNALLSPLLGRTLPEWFALPRPQLPDTIEIGILAGNRPWGLGRLIPGLPYPNDGVVTVAETRLPEARDFIVLDVSHAGMLLSKNSADQVAAFLATGRFNHA